MGQKTKMTNQHREATPGRKTNKKIINGKHWQTLRTSHRTFCLFFYVASWKPDLPKLLEAARKQAHQYPGTGVSPWGGRTPPATPHAPGLLVAELLGDHLAQLQPQAVGHPLGQVVVGAAAEQHDVGHGWGAMGGERERGGPARGQISGGTGPPPRPQPGGDGEGRGAAERTGVCLARG